jgi:hypothetical protein
MRTLVALGVGFGALTLMVACSQVDRLTASGQQPSALDDRIPANSDSSPAGHLLTNGSTNSQPAPTGPASELAIRADQVADDGWVNLGPNGPNEVQAFAVTLGWPTGVVYKDLLVLDCDHH